MWHRKLCNGCACFISLFSGVLPFPAQEYTYIGISWRVEPRKAKSNPRPATGPARALYLQSMRKKKGRGKHTKYVAPLRSAKQLFRRRDFSQSGRHVHTHANRATAGISFKHTPRAAAAPYVCTYLNEHTNILPLTAAEQRNQKRLTERLVCFCVYVRASL